MANHWAIVVGVGEYIHLSNISYAKFDAAAVKQLFEAAEFKQVYQFSDESPHTVLDGGGDVSTQPNLANLKRFFQIRFAEPFLKPSDTLWFFFSGHGLNYGNRDYLLPRDADPNDAETTAIAVDDLVDCLRHSGTDKIVLLVDACHTYEQPFGQGFGTDPDYAITLFGSSFAQIANSSDELHFGLFTVALLEGFQLLTETNSATLQSLYSDLSNRLPKLAEQYRLPIQVPRLHTRDLAPDSISIPYARSCSKAFQHWLAQHQATIALKAALQVSADQFSITNLANGSVGFF